MINKHKPLIQYLQDNPMILTNKGMIMKEFSYEINKTLTEQSAVIGIQMA